MAFSRRFCFLSLSLLLTFSHLVLSLPTPGKEALNIPSVSKSKSSQESGRTMDMIMNAMSSMSLVSNLRSLFNLSGTRYEWIPLGSLIFGNSLGQTANRNS